MPKKNANTNFKERQRWAQTTFEAGVCLIFFLSVGVIIVGLEYQEKTIIDLRIPILAALFGSIVGSAILVFSKRNFLNGICTFLIGAAIGGGLSYSAVILLNQIPNQSIAEMELLPIKSTGLGNWSKYSRCSKPFVIFSYYGLRKKLSFNCEYVESINSYSSIIVTYRTGTLGFPIIEKALLTK